MTENAKKPGYGNPPTEHRIQKGEIRNPKGRPKGSRNFRTELADVLNMKVGARGKRLTVRKAVFMKQVEKAMDKGDTRAAEIILKEAHALEEREDLRAAQAEQHVIDAEDEAVLTDALKRLAVEDKPS
ncbi:MAG: DUF5681 domain-containing protein [Hyphomonadaceae bacterium]